MVTILIKDHKTIAERRRERGSTPSLRSAPLLEDSPYDLPQTILAEGWSTIWAQVGDRCNLIREAVTDTELTAIFREVTGNMFPSIDVDYVHMTHGNVPIINTQHAPIRVCIGARTTMLHNQYGIGPLIMYLLDKCPLWIMAPEEVEQKFMSSYYCTDDDRWNRYWDNIYQPKKGQKIPRTGVYPEWCFEQSPDIPKGLPPRLNGILERCYGACHNNNMGELPLEDGTLDAFPFLFCGWYGVSEPWKDKRILRAVLNNHDYCISSEDRVQLLLEQPGDQGQGDDLTWLVIDDLYKYNENSCDQTCMPECHTQDEAEDILRRFGPYMDLIQYISHEIH